MNDDIIHHHKKIILQDALAILEKNSSPVVQLDLLNRGLEAGSYTVCLYTKLGVANLLVAS